MSLINPYWFVAAETETTDALRGCGFTTADSYAGTDTCDQYNGTDTWVSIATATACSATAGGRDSVICGGDGVNVYTNLTQKLVSGSWGSIATYPVSLGYHFSDGLYSNNDIIVAGGIDQAADASTDRTSELSSDTWASGGAMSIHRYLCLGSGTKADALVVGGSQTGAGGSYQTSCELYDGSTWDNSIGAINSARTGCSTCGTEPSTTAITAGGYNNVAGAFQKDVEIFDGSVWANTTFLTTERTYAGMAGTPEECILYGGSIGASWAPSNTSVTFDSSTWTSGATINAAVTEPAGH